MKEAKSTLLKYTAVNPTQPSQWATFVGYMGSKGKIQYINIL